MIGHKIGLSIGLWFVLGLTYHACYAKSLVFDDRDTASGSPLTPAAMDDLFNALNLERPELTSVAAALRQNDKVLAEKELARYFRTRSSVGWKNDVAGTPRLSPQNRTIADGAVQGKLQGGQVPLTYSFPNAQVDWHFNATYHVAGQARNDEWQWQLNRMSFWSDLATAYRATRDPRYADTFVLELRSWIMQCPVPPRTANISGSSWRTIEAGIRSGGSWMDAFYAFRDSPSMTDDDLLAFVHSFLDHGRYLRSRYTKLNWLTMEMSGLYAVGAEFPEFKEATEWRSFAATTIAEASAKQFLPDGAQMELSTGYQNVALDNILHIAEIARWAGVTAELPPNYLAPFENAYAWQVSLVAPDGWMPKINDSWPVYLPGVMRKAALYYPAEPSFQWFASKEQQGSAPLYSSIFLNRSGFAAMRSGWQNDANYLVFRVGPLGLGHQEQDSLGVNVWAYGRELIFNSGGGSYENSKWRQWAVSALSHNTVVVDDMPQNRPIGEHDLLHDPNMVSQGPIDAHWKTNATFDFASGNYDEGYGPTHAMIASQQRDVLFLKPDIYVVVDRVTPHDSLPHRFQARWQILTTHRRIDPLTQSLVTEDPGVPNIAIVPLLVANLRVDAVSGQEEPELLGWNIRKDINPPHVPATTLLQTLSTTGSHLILTMLIPLRAGEDNPIKKVEPGPNGVSATAFFADGRKMLISCPGPIGVSLQEILSDGKMGRFVKSEKE